MKTVEIVTDSPIVNHARHELSRAGDIYDGMVNDGVLDIIGLFAAQGHGGGSAGITTALVERLMSYEPLTPLTGDDGEWAEVMPGVHQNKRCGHVFKENGRAYDIDVEGRPTITFPYSPA